MTVALEDLAMIGDGETVALISRRATVQWLCLPRFDSPACCAALLGGPAHGHWSVAPLARLTHCEQRYQHDTLVLETDLHTAGGAIRVIDFMPVRRVASAPRLVRLVQGLSGRVPTCMHAVPRFDYGQMPPWVTRINDGAVLHVGPDKLVLRGPGRFTLENNSIACDFDVEPGSSHAFVLSYLPSHQDHEGQDDALDVQAELAQTQDHWRDWIGRFSPSDLPVPHAEALRRSLLTLKALVHRPTGGLVAAPTTSLPEQPGGSLNWDYRYCWLRDATFTVEVLVECGFLEEATAWRDWMLRAAAGAPDKLQIMYRVDGSRRVDEVELPWLAGYRYAQPVRVGNAAAGQFQLDVYGELIRALHACADAGVERTEQGRHLERAIVAHVERVWMEPDQGLWESRGQARHYTYSKVMAWVALDRHLRGGACAAPSDGERDRLVALREQMHSVICSEGYDPGLGSFAAYFGSREVDASLLLLPLVGFLPISDERMAGTIALIESTLVVDGLVWRHPVAGPAQEGAFLACSFWLAECQLALGRRSDAVATIERALAVQSQLGLLSEQYDLAGRCLAGNFPQALSHLALVHALLALRRYDHAQR